MGREQCGTKNDCVRWFKKVIAGYRWVMGMHDRRRLFPHRKSLDSESSAAVWPKQASLKPKADDARASIAGGGEGAAAVDEGLALALGSSLTAVG